MGVNAFKKSNETIDIPILKINNKTAEKQISGLNKLKKNRDQRNVQVALEEISKACKSKNNLMQPVINAAKEYATLGEIVSVMKSQFGEWRETTKF